MWHKDIRGIEFQTNNLVFAIKDGERRTAYPIKGLLAVKVEPSTSHKDKWELNMYFKMGEHPATPTLIFNEERDASTWARKITGSSSVF